jgi:ELWxxDGT repeat protein
MSSIVVFVGRDSNHHHDLWVTDGTAAGTFELTPVSGANSNGLINGANADQCRPYVLQR